MNKYTSSDLIRELSYVTAELGFRGAAVKLGSSAGALHDIVSGRRKLSHRVAQALGYDVHIGGQVYYTKKEN